MDSELQKSMPQAKRWVQTVPLLTIMTVLDIRFPVTTGKEKEQRPSLQVLQNGSLFFYRFTQRGKRTRKPRTGRITAGNVLLLFKSKRLFRQPTRLSQRLHFFCGETGALGDGFDGKSELQEVAGALDCLLAGAFRPAFR